MQSTVKSILATPSLALANTVLGNDALRRLALKVGDKRIYHTFVEKNSSGSPRRCQEDKYYMLRNMLNSINRALENKRVSPSVRRGLIKILVGKVVLESNATIRAFNETHGFGAPGFLLISPTKRGGLRLDLPVHAHRSQLYPGSYGYSRTAQVDVRARAASNPGESSVHRRLLEQRSGCQRLYFRRSSRRIFLYRLERELPALCL